MSEAPAPSRSRPERRLPRRRPRPGGAAQGRLRHRPGRGLWAGRRIGLRQVDSGAGRRPLSAAQRPVTGGKIEVGGRDVMAHGSGRAATLRATGVSMVYQDPGKALNPSLKIGRQLTEDFELAGVGRGEAQDRAIAMLKRVRIADPGCGHAALSAPALGRHAAARLHRHGAGQRSGTADPGRADDRARRDGGGGGPRSRSPSCAARSRPRSCSSATISPWSPRCATGSACSMPARWWRRGRPRQLFHHPRHPYTVALLRCLPRRGQRKGDGQLETIPGFLPLPGEEIRGCAFAPRCALADELCRSTPPPFADLGRQRSRCHYPELAPRLPRATPADPNAGTRDRSPCSTCTRGAALAKTFAGGVQALRGMELALWPGETLGLVGESGSGKTTFAKVLLGLTAPDQGSALRLDGQIIGAAARRDARPRPSRRSRSCSRTRILRSIGRTAYAGSSAGP